MFSANAFIVLGMEQAPANNVIPKNPAERRAWVNYKLRARGWTLRALAKVAGVSHQALGAALLSPNVHLEPVIAEAIGLTAQELFPERWCAATGRRLTQVRSPARHRMRSLSDPTPADGAGQRQKERVA
ncbi:helix-turn-helix domain-containing protein [Roseospira goensis]|nr:helix-turn-helix domain-containing protein [Roseospira goensis]